MVLNNGSKFCLNPLTSHFLGVNIVYQTLFTPNVIPNEHTEKVKSNEI